VEVALLGPLEVAGPAGRARVGGAKERLVLALLVLRAGEVVPRDALVDAMWGDDPPATAVKTLQGYIARVRRALEAAGLADVLATRDPGYVLQIRPDSTDVAEFERHATAGRSALAGSDAPRAAVELGKALGLWRGDALADCRGGGWAAAEALRLDELRLSTIEDRIDANLMLGNHGVLVGELESWVLRQPLRERFWGQLMVALYRAGRQADAVRAYQRARDVLVEQLGLEPGADLRRLEAAVLARDPALDAPETMRRASLPDVAIPLPRRVEAALSTVFVGRAHEREGLNRSFKSAAAGEQRMVLVSGEPGIGKTALSAAFARDAFESDAIVLYGRCDEDLGIPYQPWAEVLAHLVEHLPDDVIAAHVKARGNALARLVPHLAPGPTAARLSSDDGEAERYLLFGAVVDVLARVSALAPTVLVLDDLHWADHPTIQLLRHVAAADAPLRLLVIGTFRDSDVGADHPLAGALAALHRESGIERLALRGLGDDELLSLLEAAAGHAMAEEGVALRDALMDETDGNPFFIGEMLRHLAESGLVYQDEHGRLVASSDLRTSGLPVSIREVIGRRVARLGAQTQGALTLAAVIGRDFDTDVLSVVAELEEDTAIYLCDQAVTADVLTEADVAGRYSFRHALIEHVLYDDLSAGRRSRAHRTVAQALEEICGDEPAERTGELAYHWARAAQPQDTDKAITYAQRAGTGLWRSSHPTRRGVGTAMRSICSTVHPPTTRGVGPRSCSGWATRNARRAIPRTARPCSPPVAWPTTSTRSTSSCVPRCGTTGGTTAWPAGSTASGSTCSPARSDAWAPQTVPTARASLRCCASRSFGRPTSRSACRWRPKRSRSRAAPVTPPRWWTRFGSVTNRSRCRRHSSSADVGTARRVSSPTDSATRSHDFTPMTGGFPRRWKQATSQPSRRRPRSSRRSPSASANH
jgi:DNA-binding SARP family transcriptional activator